MVQVVWQDFRKKMNQEIVAAFTEIYSENTWGGGSGAGSLHCNTGPYREFLQQILREHDIRAVLDLGCGHFEHLSTIDWTAISYLGVDPVKKVIESNRKRFPKRLFLQGLIDQVPVPYWYDMAIIKDVFQHLPNDVVLYTLHQLRDVKWLLITNDVAPTNTDCSVGGWRAMNMTQPPFNLVSVKTLEFDSDPHRKASVLIRNDG